MKQIYSILILVIFVFFNALFFSGCTNNKILKSEIDKINVMVSLLPQVDFVERIGGEKVKVSEMIPPGFSPATYEPSPEQLKKLKDADLYFRIGHITFEKARMDKLLIVNPKMKVVDTSLGIDLLTLDPHDHGDDDEHEDQEDHEAVGGDDPHIWLSPQLVKIQARHIYETLVEYSPENAEYFTQNYNFFIDDLHNLDVKLEKAFLPIKGQTVLVFHPAFGYLADAYDFKQQAIEIEGKDVSPSQLQEIIIQAKKNNAKVVFVQSQFDTKSAEAVAQEIGGVVSSIDPLAKDYFSNLELMAITIVNFLK